MTQEHIPADPRILKQLVPVCELTAENLKDLAGKTRIEVLPAGRPLFKSGDEDNYSFYLLSGEVQLKGATDGEKTIFGGTPQARFPLDHHRPRQATAVAKNEIRYIRIDNDLLDVLLTWDQNTGYMVTEIEHNGSEAPAADDSDSDWMTSILRSGLFHRIPPANIQAMFMRMEAVPVKAGETIIHQGDEGDYYYHINKGRCTVTHDAVKTGKTIKLAELGPGSSFGEEALISGGKRNANVTMLTDGVLMRLGKADFEALLKEPVLEKVSYEEAQGMVEKGAVWLDVRLESEHRNSSIPGSLNIPLYLLRIKAPTLEQDKQYIVYCDTGRRSASAAYILSERGLDTYVLAGGLMAAKRQESA